MKGKHGSADDEGYLEDEIRMKINLDAGPYIPADDREDEDEDQGTEGIKQEEASERHFGADDQGDGKEYAHPCQELDDEKCQVRMFFGKVENVRENVLPLFFSKPSVQSCL